MSKTDPALTYDPARLVHLAHLARQARARFRGARDVAHDARDVLQDRQRQAGLTRAESRPGFAAEESAARAAADARVEAARARLAEAEAELSEAHAAAGAARALALACLDFAERIGLAIAETVDRQELVE